MPKEFDPAVTAYVRANLRSRLAPLLSLKQQAAQLGISDAQLHDVLNGGAKIGKKTLPRFAAAFNLTVDGLIKEAHEAAARPRSSSAAQITDTLEMATIAARDLVEQDAVDPAEAWAIMRGLQVADPTPRAYYFEARKRLRAKIDKPDRSASATTLSASDKAAAASKARQRFGDTERLSRRKRSGTDK